MKIHLHVGVHKTATSFMQARLKGNHAKLNRAGIGFMPLFPFRNTYVKDLMKFDPASFRLEDRLEDFFPRGVPDNVRGIIMSDENLLGLCGTMLNSGKVYSGVRARLAQLRRLLAGHEITLFCAVRRYDAFLASAYCEGLRTNPRYINFEDFSSRVNWKAISWVTLLNKIETGLRPEHIRYWRYEQFRPNAEMVLRELAFGEKLDQVESETGKPSNPSLSQAAIDAIDSVSERLGRQVAGRLVRAISATLPKSDGYPDFDPWGPMEKKRLGRRYDDDCLQIAPEKWLLPPEISAEAAQRAGAPGAGPPGARRATGYERRHALRPRAGRGEQGAWSWLTEISTMRRRSRTRPAGAPACCCRSCRNSKKSTAG